MSNVDLLPLPELPVAVERFILSSLGPMKREGAITSLRTMLREYARANMAPLQAEIDALRTRLEDTVRDSTNEIEALRAEVERLKSMTAVTMGIGRGDGNLFIHGDCDSIKAAQALVFRAERLAEALRLIESAKDQGFGIDYARGVAHRALRDHDQKVGNG